MGMFTCLHAEAGVSYLHDSVYLGHRVLTVCSVCGVSNAIQVYMPRIPNGFNHSH